MTKPFLFLALPIAGYLLASWLLWRRLTQSGEVSRATRLRILAGIAVLAGLAGHSVLLAGSLPTSAGLNLSLTNVLSLVSWVAVAMLLAAAIARPVENLGILVLPVAATLVLLAHWFPGKDILTLAATPAQSAHIVVSLLAYSLLLLATLQGLLLLFQERHLRSHQPGGLLRALPPMQTMETLMFQMIGVGFVLLTLTVASGVLFSEAVFGRPLRFNHHTVLAIAAWVVFGVLLLGHWRLGWRGRIAVRWTVAGFLLLVLGYFGTKFVVEVLLGR
jgi:ABC-type uncharacterized transport system permease subunit